MDELTLKNLRALEGHAKLQQGRIDKLGLDLVNIQHQQTQTRNELAELAQQFNLFRAMHTGTGPTSTR